MTRVKPAKGPLRHDNDRICGWPVGVQLGLASGAVASQKVFDDCEVGCCGACSEMLTANRLVVGGGRPYWTAAFFFASWCHLWLSGSAHYHDHVESPPPSASLTGYSLERSRSWLLLVVETCLPCPRAWSDSSWTPLL